MNTVLLIGIVVALIGGIIVCVSTNDKLSGYIGSLLLMFGGIMIGLSAYQLYTDMPSDKSSQGNANTEIKCCGCNEAVDTIALKHKDKLK
jgi:uncharacterized membrane-anchored protein